ncbi:MAG TPA: hypothetical protein VIH89_14825 [Candidatus Sulfotelmatobacter sp.]|jgi:hypothetical protein
MQVNFKNLRYRLFVLILSTGVIVSAASGKAKDKEKEKGKTFTGTVGDTLCGLEHSMPGSAVDCIRECIGKGSNYSLIIGDKVYNLQTEDKAILETLEKQAGLPATVTGVEDGTNIAVTSVKAAK